VWNDQLYDSVAIYTGSATIVNGVPTMVYPGLCTKHLWDSCDTGTLLAIAVPANHAGDPLLTNWSKPAYNPIVNNTQRDPSTAWQTASGEWRLTTYEGRVYGSDDFETWWTADAGAAIFPVAECPDFFTIPPPCTGNGCERDPDAVGPAPTHVHKQSSGGQDWYTLGNYADGPDRSTGTWTPTPGLPALNALDASAYGGKKLFYASKSQWSMEAPVKGRRIYWGWALVPPASTQTLPRVTNYHAGLNILTFNPLPEMAALRASPPLFSAPTLQLAANTSLWLGDWAPGAGNSSEIGVTFILPPTNASFGLTVMAGRVGSGGANVSTPVLITYDPVAFTASVSVGGVAANLSHYMPGTDLPGGDYNVTDVTYSDPRICQAACNSDGEKCQAFTYVVRPPLKGSCCLKGGVPSPDANPTRTSGVKHGGGSVVGGTTAQLPLLPGDTAIDVRVFVDGTIVEVFVMGGRLAFTATVNAGAEAGAAGVTLFAGPGAGGVSTTGAAVWHMHPIWATTEEVLATAAAKRLQE
jgi:hypothetical protein